MKGLIHWMVFMLAAFAPSAFGQEQATQFFKQVKSPPLDQEEILAVQLDAEIYASTADDFADLRVLDSNQNTIPYLSKLAQTTRIKTTRKSWQARSPSARPLDGGGLEITIALHKDDPQPDGFRMITPLRNFQQRLRVYTSNDGENWEPRGEETEIFDYSRYMDVRSDSVALPATQHRHFRIVVDDLTSEQESDLIQLTRRLRGGKELDRQQKFTVDRRPFRIDRIEFWTERQKVRVTGEQKKSYSVEGFRVEEDTEKQQTKILVDTRREPLTSFTVRTTTGNFSRQAVVEVEETQGKKSSWRTLGSGVLSRIEFKNLKRQDLEITFPETRRKQYRIVIDNRDSPPLAITGVEAVGNVREVLFLAEPGKDYRVTYHSAKAELPDYDTAAIAALLREGFEPTETELGEQQAGGPDIAAKASFWDLLRDPRFLVGLIVVLVIVLSWALYSATRRLDSLPSEQEVDGEQKA